MPAKLYPDVAARVMELLQLRPMLQTEIADQFPLDRYLDVQDTLLYMDRAGMVVRERRRSTYMVELAKEKQNGQH